jgi:hypothetical protein
MFTNVTNNLVNTFLSQMDFSFIEFPLFIFSNPWIDGILFILLISAFGIISIGSFILYSANATKEGLKKAGRIITGVGVGGSVYTGVKEVYKDLKDLVSTDNSSSEKTGDTSKGSTSTDKTDTSTSKK